MPLCCRYLAMHTASPWFGSFSLFLLIFSCLTCTHLTQLKCFSSLSMHCWHFFQLSMVHGWNMSGKAGNTEMMKMFCSSRTRSCKRYLQWNCGDPTPPPSPTRNCWSCCLHIVIILMRSCEKVITVDPWWSNPTPSSTRDCWSCCFHIMIWGAAKGKYSRTMVIKPHPRPLPNERLLKLLPPYYENSEELQNVIPVEPWWYPSPARVLKLLPSYYDNAYEELQKVITVELWCPTPFPD